jgi:Tol biopolymer transport system component
MTMRNTIPLLSHIALAIMAAAATAQTAAQNEVRLREAMHKEQVEGDLPTAIRIYQSIASDKGDRSLAAKALVQLGRCYEKQGNTEARKAYERVLREFADQGPAASEARTRLARMKPPARRTEMAARRLTQPMGAYPLRTVTRDGRYTAYMFMRRSVIVLLDLSTGKEREVGGGRRLIPPGDWGRTATISPGGAEVAYDQVHPDGTSDLCIIGVNATGPRVLQRGLNAFFIADWSRDGSAILIREMVPTANSRPLRSLLVDVRSGEARVVKSSGLRGSGISVSQMLGPQFRAAQFRISPDVKFLADTFSESPQTGGTGVFVTAVGDDKSYKIAGAPADAYLFGWSPDGEQLLYISNQSGHYDLWAVPMRDGRPSGVPVVLKKDLGLALSSGIADDGSLYYSVTSSFGNVYLGELDIAAAAVRNLQSVPQRPGELKGSATWSPDGSRLLMDRLLDPFATKGIIRDVATGDEKEIGPPPGSFSPTAASDGQQMNLYQSRWAPDGKSIVYLIHRGRLQDSEQVIVTDLQTGLVSHQAQIASRFGHMMPTVAPDGRHVYAARGANGMNASRVVRIDLETGQEQEICAARPSVWALSPDGSQIACAGLGGAIQIVPTNGGSGRELVRADEFGPMTWTADGKHLIYTTATDKRGTGPGGPGSYWIVPSAGGKPRKLDINLSTMGLMSIHPDNSHIAISSGGTGTELWVLENVLRSSR